jgi:hypothetical protein
MRVTQIFNGAMRAGRIVVVLIVLPVNMLMPHGRNLLAMMGDFLGCSNDRLQGKQRKKKEEKKLVHKRDTITANHESARRKDITCGADLPFFSSKLRRRYLYVLAMRHRER